MAKSKSSATGTSRSPKSGRFVLGSRAFGKASAVEGVVVSRGLMAELRRLGNVTPEKRGAALAHKYGKNDAGLCTRPSEAEGLASLLCRLPAITRPTKRPTIRAVGFLEFREQVDDMHVPA
jgi:hypothetical protein